MVSRVQIHFTDVLAMTKLGQALEQMLQRAGNRPISVVCIGTDRATGDALGPLVGRILSSLRLPVRVFGTIKNPVGANNLAEIVAELEVAGDFVVAVDASLGGMDDVGRITAWSGPLRPGAGVGKTLPAVGELAILGCVNIGALAPMQVLQCTRLDTVLEMADVIAYALSYAIRRHAQRRDVAVPAVAGEEAEAPRPVLAADAATVDEAGARLEVAVAPAGTPWQLPPLPAAPPPQPVWKPLFPFRSARRSAVG